MISIFHAALIMLLMRQEFVLCDGEERTWFKDYARPNEIESHDKILKKLLDSSLEMEVTSSGVTSFLQVENGVVNDWDNALPEHIECECDFAKNIGEDQSLGGINDEQMFRDIGDSDAFLPF
eukprot:g1489.t1